MVDQSGFDITLHILFRYPIRSTMFARPLGRDPTDHLECGIEVLPSSLLWIAPHHVVLLTPSPALAPNDVRSFVSRVNEH